jgi:ABC-type uncharacterized transport system substrate-binding protein
MRRRAIIGLAFSAAMLCIGMLARGQQSIPIIGILGSSAADDYGPMITAFRKGLSETGYLEGKNVGFEYAWADDHYDRLPALASKLIERRVNVILAAATPSALAVFVVAGGIMSYGGDIKDSYYHAGIYAGRILNGERPANLAVQLSTRVEFFINLKTAKALGLEPTAPLMARADEVIE